MSTRLEALEQAFEGLQAEQEAAQATEPVRDEEGKFAAPEQKEQEAVVEPAQEAASAAEPALETKPRPAPPSSWKPEKRAKWDTLDPEIAEYINQREEETNRGVEPLKRVWHEISPYLQRIQSNGQTPEAMVRDLLHTANTLATGDANTKRATLLNIARSYGVSLDPQQSQQAEPQTAHLMSELQQVKQTVLTWQQQQEQDAQRQAQQMIAEFSKDRPHFDSVKGRMGELIQKGLAQDLDSAYKLAIRMDDAIFEQTQRAQRDADEQAKRAAADAAAKAAKANAVSPRSATPSAVQASTVTAKGRRAALEQAVNALQSGRI